MKESFSQSMDWLHTWAGLLFGWLLFAIFFTGTLSVFDQEITRWMQPELHRVTPAPLDLDAASRTLNQLAPHADRWVITLPYDRKPVGAIGWQHDGLSTLKAIDSRTGTVIPRRETRGGDFFFRFHYQLLLDQPGIWIVGVSAMAMLAVLVTGIVIHHRIFKDFFTFRPSASFHRSWLDAHNVTGVLVFPFHVMITFTGLVIFWAIYMPAGIQTRYEGDMNAFWAEAELFFEREPANQPAPLVSLADLEREARNHWKDGQTRSIVVEHPGDRHALVHMYRRSDDRLSLDSGRVTFDGAGGALRAVWLNENPAYLTQSVLTGLHFVRFGGSPMRWLYFGMGLAASAMIATGLVLWVVKRQGRHAGADAVGYRLVEGLNVAAVAGLLVATATFFWANRLLLPDLEARDLWELRIFFAAWSLCLGHALLHEFLRDGASLKIWTTQLVLAALLFGLLPILNAFTTESHLFVTLPQGQWHLAAVDLTTLMGGLVLGWTAWRLHHPVRTSARSCHTQPVSSSSGSIGSS
ncbi:MAG: PepSY-associated TM helix domain-containing protein [Nitrospirales bacterium]|nr:PepSY domain-containing protein [Nitrospirales bacterium]